MFTKEAIALAPKAYEAIKKIAEKAGKKCPDCYGYGIVDKDKIGGELACGLCNGTGKIKGKWKWKPEIYDVYKIEENGESDGIFMIVSEMHKEHIRFLLDKKCSVLPLFHWEKIEKILKGMGYYFYICNKRRPTDNIYIEIRQGNMFGEMIIIDQGKTRQEAVMRAVIELEKEAK